MGFYDRDYMRQEGRSYIDAIFPEGRVCKWLIGINLVLFVLQLITKPRIPFDDFNLNIDPALLGAGWGPVTSWLELVPQKVMHGEVWRLLSYAFLHDPSHFYHILFNMLFLWWFGSDVEHMHGSREFLIFYMLSALLGGAAQTAYGYAIGHPLVPCVGASGAVTATMVVFACHFPNKMILVFFMIPVPIWVLVVFQVAKDAYFLLTNTATPIAVSVHLAGAAFGFLYYRQTWRLSGFDLIERFRAWRRRRARPSLRLYRPEEREREPIAVAAPSAPSAPLDEHLEAKVDAVLEKVARSGKDSLTEDERRILMRASEIYRKRRS